MYIAVNNFHSSQAELQGMALACSQAVCQATSRACQAEQQAEQQARRGIGAKAARGRQRR